MTRPSIHISLPKPCHEKWNGMTAVDRGAFCQSCSKEVIDFSTMTDAQLIAYLAREKPGCGRFRKDQIGRTVTTARVENGFMKWRALLLGLLPFFAFKEAVASIPIHAPMDQNPVSKKSTPDKALKTLPASILISGTVLDGDGEPVAGASIEVRKSSQSFGGNGAVSDANGCFEIRLEQREFADGMPYLKASNDHYSNICHLNKDSVQNITIRLEDERLYVLGGMSVEYITTYCEVKKPENLVKKFARAKKEKDATPAGDLCIYGNIKDNGGPLQNTSIRVLDSAGVFYGNGAVTDSAGNYSIYLDKTEHRQKKFCLEITRDGYYPRTIFLNNRDLQEQSFRLHEITGPDVNRKVIYKESTLLQWRLLKMKYWFKKHFKSKS